MKVVKNINNNVSLCIDKKGRECIAFGKGIGFIKPPYEVPLSQIERTFYSNNLIDYEGIKNVPEQIIRLAIHIVDEAERNLHVTFMSTTALALADHIYFAIQRMHQHMSLKLPLREDMKQLYANELSEAYKALDLIEKDIGVKLSKDEAPTIALHFINNRVGEENTCDILSKKMMKECIAIIEKEYSFSINKESFNYSRFVTHLDFLVRRTTKNDQISSVNVSMFEALRKEYPSAYTCVLKISEKFKENLKKSLSDEEKMYLMLHINRLCIREQKE